MFHSVNAGAAGANALTAYNRRDAGIAAANNALTGIRASHGAFIKRAAAPDAAEQEAPSAVSAGIAAAKRLANAAAPKAEVSIVKRASAKPRDGGYTALFVFESSEEGRELLAKIRAADPDREILHSSDTGFDYIYTGDIAEDELARIRQCDWESVYGKTAQPAAVVKISDEGRELAAQISEPNPVSTVSGFRFVPDGDNSFKIVPDEATVVTISADSKPKIIRDGDNTVLMLPENFIESHREAKAQRLANPPVDELGELMREAMAYNVDNTLLFSLYTNTEMDTKTAFKLASELGRLLSDPRETLETRVANREKGLKFAEYIAQNYIDDPAAKQTFIDRAKEVANLYEMRDKGYDIYWTMDEKLHIDKPDDNLLVIAGKPTVKAATDIIDRAKNSLNMNTVKEDALNILKKIMANAGSHYLYNPDGTFVNTEEFRAAMLSKLA